VYEGAWRKKNQSRLAEARAKRREKDKVYREKYNRKNPARYLCSRIARRCQEKGIPFDLDQYEEELNFRIRRGFCELTGLPIAISSGAGMQWNSASLDRIVPSHGYTYSNIRVVCFAMNAALGNWGEAAFRRVATAYLERNL